MHCNVSYETRFARAHRLHMWAKVLSSTWMLKDCQSMSVANAGRQLNNNSLWLHMSFSEKKHDKQHRHDMWFIRSRSIKRTAITVKYMTSHIIIIQLVSVFLCQPTLYSFIWYMVFILYYFELIYNQCPYSHVGLCTYTFCCVYLIKINQTLTTYSILKTYIGPHRIFEIFKTTRLFRYAMLLISIKEVNKLNKKCHLIQCLIMLLY